MATTTPRPIAEATEVRPEDIVPHPLNPRESADPDEGLIASVRELGVLERLVLAPVPDDLPASARRLLVPEAELLLIAGHRRLAAALEAELPLVPVDVRHDLDTTEKQLAAIASENIHRTDLNAVEEGDLYLALGDLGLSQAQISERTSVAKPRISQRTRVAKLPQTLRQRLANHQMTLDAADTFTKINDDPAEVERIAAMPPYLWEQEVSKVTRARELARWTARREKELADAGVTVLDEYPPTPDVEEGGDGEPWWRLDDLMDSAFKGFLTETAKHRGIEVDPDSDDIDHLELNEDDVEEWHQATCEGHRVVRQTVRSWQGEETVWVPICTTPNAHDDLMDGAAPMPGSPAAREAAGEDSEPVEDEATIARRGHLRRRVEQHTRWLAALLQEGHEAIEKRAWEEARRQVGPIELDANGNPAQWAGDRIERRRRLLGLPDTVTPRDVEDVFAAYADRLDVAGLMVLYDVVGHGPAYGDAQMSQPGGFGFGWAEDRVRMLHSLGWLWDDQELDEIRKHPQLAESLGLAEDDAEGGDAA